MKVYELLTISRSLLNVMKKNTLQIKDVEYIELINDYNQMAKEGYKKTYIVLELSVRYDIPERTMYRIIDKMLRNVDTSEET